MALDAVQFATMRTQTCNSGRLGFDMVFRLRFLLIQLPQTREIQYAAHGYHFTQ